MSADLCDWIFDPKSLAVIGASSDSNKLGGRPIRYLKENAFRGKIYPVNPNLEQVQGLPSFRSVGDIPGEVDQAVIIVPAVHVERAVSEAVAKGVKVIQVLSSGFAEAGTQGKRRQDRILSIAREGGVRLIGPNSLGTLSPITGAYITFSTSMLGARISPGVVGFATQSGAFGSCAYVMAAMRGLGVSRVIATGNEADVDVAECIGLLADDPQTKVICAAIEACKDGRSLRQNLLKAATARKPVVIMKIGVTDLGAKAAASHTGALAGDDRAFGTVVRECGALRVQSIEEMIDFAYVATVGQLPASNAVAVLSISGGIGILMADDAILHGLKVPRLTSSTNRAVREVVPFVQGRNPIDMTAQISATEDKIGDLARKMLEQRGFGTLLLYLSNTALSSVAFQRTQETLLSVRQEFPEILIVCVMPCSSDVRTTLEGAGIVIFEDPTRAIRAVAGVSAFEGRWVQCREQERRGRLQKGAAGPLPPILNEASAKAYLATVGIPVLDERVCRSVAEAQRAAEDLGFPVVAKLLSRDFSHKTEIGGVVLGLADTASVGQAYEDLLGRGHQSNPEAVIEGVLIAPMMTGGLETIIGFHRDPTFGPMVLFGLGGIFVHAIDEVALASVPVSRRTAERLVVNSIKGAMVLFGSGRRQLFDHGAIASAIQKLSDLAASSSDIDSIDINPFLVFDKGAVALDALIIRR